MNAEPGIATAIGVLGPVFLPKKYPGHAGATQLPVDLELVGFVPTDRASDQRR